MREGSNESEYVPFPNSVGPCFAFSSNTVDLLLPVVLVPPALIILLYVLDNLSGSKCCLPLYLKTSLIFNNVIQS